MGAAARGMLLFPRDAETGAHQAAFVLPALPDPNAAQGGFGEASVVLGKLEVSLRLPRLVARSQPEVIIHFVRQDDLARIHLPIGIPQRLEFLECRNQFRPEHLRIKLSASLTVAMFTGEGSAIGDD